MEKEQKIYDLDKILSAQSYNRLMNYLVATDKFGSVNNDYGRDGLAMIGSGAYPSEVCQMFNLLADPEFVNLRNDWGDITGQENEPIPNIDDYANGAKNSFSIKKNIASNSAFMDFPLKNNYMTIDGQVKHIPFEDGFDWETQKSLIEQSMQATMPDFKIEDNQEFDKLFDYEEKSNPKFVSFGAENKTKRSAVAKIIHASLSVFKKMYKAVGVNFPFENQLKKYGPQHSTTVCYVSNKFKNQNMSNLDKFVAVVDALTYEKLKEVEKTRAAKNELNKYPEDDQRKILMASKLIANWAVCMASNLGVENHKQMDNALKLELNSILGTLPQDNKKVTTVIANISKDLTSEMFKDFNHLNYAAIVEHRKDLGLQYVEDFNLGAYSTWSEMKGVNANALDLHQVLFGRTIPTEKVMTLENGNIQFKGYSPAFNELQPEAGLVSGQPQPVPIPAQNLTPPLQPASQPAPQDQSKNPQPDAATTPAGQATLDQFNGGTSTKKDRQTTLDEFNDVIPQKDDDLIHVDPISGVVSATNGKKDAPKSTKEDEEFDINDGGAFNGSASYIINNVKGKDFQKPPRKVDQSQIEKLREERKLRKEQANKQYPELLKLLEDKDEKGAEAEKNIKYVGFFVPKGTKKNNVIFKDKTVFVEEKDGLSVYDFMIYDNNEIGLNLRKYNPNSKSFDNAVAFGESKNYDVKVVKGRKSVFEDGECIGYVGKFDELMDYYNSKDKTKAPEQKNSDELQQQIKPIRRKIQTPNPVYSHDVNRYKITGPEK